jgi:hypothetical protein
VRPPVFLRRRPDEPADQELASWYQNLLALVAGHQVRAGEWQLLQVTGWADNQSCRDLLAWSWAGHGTGGRHVVVINLSARPAQGRVRLGWADLPGRISRLADLFSGSVFERDGGELASPGLFVALEPWQFHLLALE